MIRKILLVLAFAFCVSQAQAQVATGLYAYGSFDNQGFDSINRGSLNVHFQIPVVNKAGRGMSFQYLLDYEGLVWAPSGAAGAQTWNPDSSFGLHGVLANEGSGGFITFQETSQTKCYTSGSQFYFSPIYGNYVYHDDFGMLHSFAYTMNICLNTTTGSGASTDGSGFTILASNEVRSRSGGTLLLPSYQSTSGTPAAGTLSDANGNQVSNTQSGVFTDTLGKNILTITGSGTAASPKVLSYLTYGGSANTTITYQTLAVQTVFGCSGIGEYNQSVALPYRVTLADGSFYQFNYEPTPGQSSHVTGRLASVTLPTGGVISYAYTGANNGINCADGTPTGITRTTSNGTRTYVRSAIAASTSQTAITDGLNNTSIYNFVAAGAPTTFYETNRSVYQGATSGALLLSRYTCYNASSSPCTTTAVSTPITQIDTYETLNGQEHGSTAKYNSYGLQTEIDAYDYAAGARGGLLRKEVWAYPSSGIVNLVSSDTVYDGSNNQIGLTTYAYDETSGTGHAALVTTSGLPQHGGAVGSQRGNLTTTTQWNNDGASLITSSAYEDTGNPLTTTTPNGQASFAYDSATHAFTTTATPPTPSSGVSLPSSATNDTGTGLPLTATDPNGQVTTYKSYDALLRPTEIDYPDGGKTAFSYPSPNVYVVLPYQNANNKMQTYHDIDAYGRADRISAYNGQSGPQWYQQDTCFDANSNVEFQSYTYQGTGLNGAKECSGAGDTYSYDALGRVLSIKHADGTSIGYTYTARATQVKDENGVTHTYQVDGLGRLSIVCELSNQAQQGTAQPGTCSGDITAQGFASVYSYTTDTSNNNNQETIIRQGVQTRISEKDSLGRTVSMTESERGATATTYSYPYNSTGLSVIRERPKANQGSSSTLTKTTTQYDSLGRLLSISYDDSLTPPKSYSYDVGNWAESGSQQNLKGHLSLASTTNTTGTLYSYDPMGRVISTWQCTPSTCGNGAKDKPMSFTYDWTGALLSQSDLVSGTIAYGRSIAGEITSMTNSTFQGNGNPANLVSNVVNGPDGPASYQLGNGLNVYKNYDSLGRGTGRWLCNGPAAQYCNGGVQVYGNGQAFRGSQVSWNDDTAVGTQLVFAYDQLNRLASTSLYQASSPLYTYAYDIYGNRWSQAASGGNTFSASFDPTTNRINSAGYAYDAAGNMTNDSFHNYTFDAEGNILTVDGGTTAKYVYNALNQRVQSQVGGSTLEYVYDYQGRRISTWAEPANTGTEGRIYSDNQQIAFRSSDGTTYFDHQDYLGTERMRTNSTGAVVSTYSSLPWGDGYSANVTTGAADQDSAHFAGLDQDLNSANAAMSEHAQFRNYSFQQGRWLSPDLYNGSYDLNNPQSFNRYAYVLNNPLSLIDPTGQDCYTIGGDTWAVDSGDGSVSSGSDSGGTVCTDPGSWACQEYGYCGGNTGGGGRSTPAPPPPPYVARLSNAPSNGQQQGQTWKQFGQAAKSCAASSFGLSTAAAGGAVAAGTNALSTAGKFAGMTPGTSVASQFFRSVLPQAIESTWAPTLMNPLSTSGVLGGVVGRWVPVVGEAILVAQGANFVSCLWSSDDNY